VLSIKAVPADELPVTFDLSSPTTVRKALSALMPGHWSDGYLRAIVATQQASVGSAPGTIRNQLAYLAATIDFSKIPTVTEPWGPSAPQLFQALREVSPNTRPALLCPADPHAALHPQAYRVKPPFVLTRAHEWVLDLVLGLSVSFATHAVFALGPITYVTNGPPARRNYLRLLASEDRLQLVPCESVRPGQVQQIWICVFATKALRRTLARHVRMGGQSG